MQTNTIQLGTGLTCPILRYHPSIIAQAAATVSHFAPNRTYLGLGTGEALNEYAATGQWPEYESRQQRLEEAITLIRKLWTGEEVSFEGTYYQTKKARLFTPPATRIPIYISALVPESAAFAGIHGDGLFSVGGKTPAIYQQLLQSFEQGARTAQKDPSQMPRLIELNVAYGGDINAAIQEQLKYWAGTYVPTLFDQKIYTPKMSAENGEAIGADTVKKTGCFSNDPKEQVQFLQQYVELGFDTIIVHSAGPDQQGFLESYARDILPHIRSKQERVTVTTSVQ